MEELWLPTQYFYHLCFWFLTTSIHSYLLFMYTPIHPCTHPESIDNLSNITLLNTDSEICSGKNIPLSPMGVRKAEGSITGVCPHIPFGLCVLYQPLSYRSEKWENLQLGRRSLLLTKYAQVSLPCLLQKFGNGGRVSDCFVLVLTSAIALCFSRLYCSS